ncbi:MAG: phosphate signaling complex protein PhoU, partial [Deltaproteobacteria bacterium]
VAYDLRFIATVLKFVTDLERIGDKAVSIAKRAKDVAAHRPPPVFDQLAAMSVAAQAMLRSALDAFVSGDAARAEEVLCRDDEVDRLRDEVRDQTVAWMHLSTENIDAGLAVLSVGRHLERVADHATNLAEQVVFLVRGDDVRHRSHPPRGE